MFSLLLQSSHNVKKSCVLKWNAICVYKRRLQFIFHQVEQLVCQKIQRNVIAALAAFLSTKRKLSVLSGLSVFLTKRKACGVLQRAFSSWNTCTKFFQFRAKSVDRIFKKMHDQPCLSEQKQKLILGCWKLAASRSLKGSLIKVLIQNVSKRALGRRFFNAWHKDTALFFEREHRLFKNKTCFSVAQKMFRFWAIHVLTRVTKSSQLIKKTLLLAVQEALRSWAFAVLVIKKVKAFESRRLLNDIKKWQCIVAIKCRFKAQDALIRKIFSRGQALNLCRFMFRLWFEYTNMNLARSKRLSAAVEHGMKRNQKWLRNAFITWIRVKTTGFGVKRIVSERLRKLFFRWHTFVEYRRSKSLLKSKLQQQASPPSNAR
jgi:hypothetical protein